MLKISELIARLEELKDKHGDLPVWLIDMDRGPFPVESVEFRPREIDGSSIVYQGEIPDRVELD